MKKKEFETDYVGINPSIPTVEEIEQWIIEAGSDNVPTFGGTFEGGIQVQQIPDEIAPCLHTILEAGTRIENYLEIGAAAGGSIVMIDHWFKPTRITFVDDNRHPKAHIRSYVLGAVLDRLGDHLIEIIGESQHPGTVELLTRIGLRYDMVFLDGNHTYDAVRQDIENYLPFLLPGGWLMMHDAALPEWGIIQTVRELKADQRVQLVGEWQTKNFRMRPCGVALFRKVAADEG